MFEMALEFSLIFFIYKIIIYDREYPHTIFQIKRQLMTSFKKRRGNLELKRNKVPLLESTLSI